jgi:anti-anti-sigma factor
VPGTQTGYEYGEGFAMDQKRWVHLDGDYDLSRRDELRQLLEAIAEGPVTLDLSKVTFFDSLALQELARLKNRLSDITLAGADANIRRLLSFCGFDHIFNFVDK